MLELWLIRHGQTDWNVEGRFQGSADIPLNGTGIKQAETLAKNLNGHAFAAIYSSDLKRAKRTAEAISEVLNINVQTDKRIREISQGDWEGVLFTDINEQYPQELLQRKSDPVNFRPPGGETVKEVFQRACDFIDEIAKQYTDNKVIIVSHGLTLSTLICKAKNLALSEAYKNIPENAEPYIIQWKNI